MGYDENAHNVYERLYLARDKNDNIIENIDECHIRVASFLSNNTDEYNAFKSLLDSQKFRPNTPCMTNAGIKTNPMMLACHVLPLEDNMDSIIDMWSTCSHIYKDGGGAGIPITNLRREDGVLSTGGFASGPVKYLSVIDTVSNTVKSGGKARRAANKVDAKYNHPDIIRIVNSKRDKQSLQSINISVAVDNEFMNNVIQGRDVFIPYLDPNEGKIQEGIYANELWKSIIDAAWETGDPGLLFMDRINQDNPLQNELGFIECTNPCFTGETKVWTIYGPKSFEELAKENKNIPVLSQNQEGKVEFRMMRNPRKTRREKQSLIRILFDDGQSLDCTPDHKWYVKTGEGNKKVKAKDLQPNQSISSVYRYNANQYKRELKCDKKVIKRRLEADNHKISHITYLSEKKFVYNGTVDENHNFFVHVGENDGVLVANCGESPIWSATSCNLGHINLNKYTLETLIDIEDKPLSYLIRTNRFVHDIYYGVLFLNRIVEKTSLPNEKFRERMMKYKPIGLGLMGFSDLLYDNYLEYGSDTSINLIDHITKNLTKYSFLSSLDFAEKGIFDSIQVENSIDRASFCRMFEKFTNVELTGILPANCTVTTIAPTGSTAISANCSYSTEPAFGLSWIKNLSDGTKMTFISEKLETELEAASPTILEEDIERIKKEIREEGSLQKIDLPSSLTWMKKVFVTAHDIDNYKRIDVQAAAQKNITMAISSTVNLPNNATIDDISQIYKYAYKRGLKGVTIFRDGCLDFQPVTFGGEKEEFVSSSYLNDATLISGETILYGTDLHPTEKEKSMKKKRPKNLAGTTEKIETGSGTLYLTINELDNGEPFEVFAVLGKSGKSVAAKAESIGRLVSLCLRSGIPVKEIVNQLSSIGGDNQIFQEGGLVKSIPDAIAKILDKNYCNVTIDTVQKRNGMESKETMEKENPTSICPMCGEPSLRMDAGCRGGICTNCGWSKCD